MANGNTQQTQQTPTQNKPTTPNEIAVDAFNKEVAKQVKESTAQRLQSGQPPQQVLSELMGSLGINLPTPTPQAQQQVSQQEILDRIISLSQTPIPTGQKAGLIPSLIKTGELKRIPQTTTLGFDDAAKVVELQLKQEQRTQELPKEQLDFIRTLQSVVASTPQGLEEAEFRKAAGQARAQEAKEAAETERNFKIARDKLKLTMKKFDAAVKETQRLTGGVSTGQGRIGGTVTALLGAVGANPKVKSFQGDLVETSTAIAKIAAPSAKVGPDLINLFSTTLPNIGFFTTSTSLEAQDQIVTSITNAFINYLATHPEEAEGADVDIFEAQMREMIGAFTDRGTSLFQQDATGKPGEVVEGLSIDAATGSKTAAEIELEQINRQIQQLEGGQ